MPRRQVIAVDCLLRKGALDQVSEYRHNLTKAKMKKMKKNRHIIIIIIIIIIAQKHVTFLPL